MEGEGPELAVKPGLLYHGVYPLLDPTDGALSQRVLLVHPGELKVSETPSSAHRSWNAWLWSSPAMSVWMWRSLCPVSLHPCQPDAERIRGVYLFRRAPCPTASCLVVAITTKSLRLVAVLPGAPLPMP